MKIQPLRPPRRYPAQPATDNVLRLLNLEDRLDSQDQDWELTLADPARLTEFCDLYESSQVDDNMQLPLMELIIFSLDEAYRELNTGDEFPEIGSRVERLLRENFVRHLFAIRHSCLPYLNGPDYDDPDCIFPVTPMMRSIWNDCFKPEFQTWTDTDQRV